MRVTEDKGFLSSLFPNVMKKTRLLIIDHDVCRYHSYDLLRYQLFRDTQIGDKEHFMSIKPDYRFLLKSGIELAQRVKFAQNNLKEFNIYQCFDKDLGIETSDQYAGKICEMFHDPGAKVTMTDVSRTQFNIIFDRQNIDGFLLKYTGENNRPSCYNKLTVYEAENILDLNTAVAIIKQDRINTVMLCTTELAVRLAIRLQQEGYTDPITFIIARYAYNFVHDNGSMLYPMLGEEIGTLEMQYKHEFGFFDPFSTLTYRERYIKETEVQQNDEQ